MDVTDRNEMPVLKAQKPELDPRGRDVPTAKPSQQEAKEGTAPRPWTEDEKKQHQDEIRRSPQHVDLGGGDTQSENAVPSSNQAQRNDNGIAETGLRAVGGFLGATKSILDAAVAIPAWFGNIFLGLGNSARVHVLE